MISILEINHLNSPSKLIAYLYRLIIGQMTYCPDYATWCNIDRNDDNNELHVYSRHNADISNLYFGIYDKYSNVDLLFKFTNFESGEDKPTFEIMNFDFQMVKVRLWDLSGETPTRMNTVTSRLLGVKVIEALSGTYDTAVNYNCADTKMLEVLLVLKELIESLLGDKTRTFKNIMSRAKKMELILSTNN